MLTGHCSPLGTVREAVDITISRFPEVQYFSEPCQAITCAFMTVLDPLLLLPASANSDVLDNSTPTNQSHDMILPLRLLSRQNSFIFLVQRHYISVDPSKDRFAYLIRPSR